MTDWGEWFKAGMWDAKWLKESPSGSVSRCDMSWSHVVQPDQSRLMLDSGMGPIRKRGKSKRHEYLCRSCALSIYQLTPPSMMMENQEKMF